MDTGGTGLIDKALVSDNVQKDLQKLLKGESVIYEVMNYISFEDPTSLMSLLLYAGYLKVSQAIDEEMHLYALSIPNKEVKYI